MAMTKQARFGPHAMLRVRYVVALTPIWAARLRLP
jgi:hypothetical protein